MPVRRGTARYCAFPKSANGSMKAATFIPGRILTRSQSKIILGELEPVCTAPLVIRGLWRTRSMRAAAPRKIAAAQRARWARASGLIRKKVPMTIALLGSPPALVIHSRQERLIVYLVRMDFVSKSYHSPNRFCRASHRRGDLANRVPGHLRHVLLLI